MEKENIEVYNLTVVELKSRELSKSEAEIAKDGNFAKSIANIAKNAIEKLQSICDKTDFGLYANEDDTGYEIAIKVVYKEDTTAKCSFIKDLAGTLISVITRYISSCDVYKTEINDMLNEYPENETRESDSKLEETEEE